jgi:hypothetical protein
VQDQDSRGTRVNKTLCRAPPAWAAETEVIALRRESQDCPRLSWDSLISAISIERPLVVCTICYLSITCFICSSPHFPLQAISCFSNFFCLYIFQKTLVHSVHYKIQALSSITTLFSLPPLCDSQASTTAV